MIVFEVLNHVGGFLTRIQAPLAPRVGEAIVFTGISSPRRVIDVHWRFSECSSGGDPKTYAVAQIFVDMREAV